MPPAAGAVISNSATRAWATRSRPAWASAWRSPRARSIVLIGDGTYLMNPTELVTAVQEGLKITVVVAENHGYQCIRRLQMWRTGVSFGNEFRHRDPATNRLEGDYVRIDLAANAESFGARAWHVETPEQLAPGAARGPRRDAAVRDRRRGREAPRPARRRRAGGTSPRPRSARTRRPASCGPSTSAIKRRFQRLHY